MSSSRGSPIRYEPNQVEECYALYLLRVVFRRDYSCQESLNLGAKEASVFFSLSGQDKALLKHIWVLVVINEQNAEATVNALTDVSQLHTFLRFLALAQTGTLVQALAQAFRQTTLSKPEQGDDDSPDNNHQTAVKLTPARVMTDCLCGTRDAFIPLPRFAGIEVPKLAVLELIYQQLYNGQSRDDVAKRKQAACFFRKCRQRNGQVPLDDSDRTIHTSNVRRLDQQPQQEQFLDDDSSKASHDDFATDASQTLGPSHDDSQSSCRYETEFGVKPTVSASTRQDEPPVPPIMHAPAFRRIVRSQLFVVFRVFCYFVMSLTLIRTWTRHYRVVSLDGPVTGFMMLFLHGLYSTGLIDQLDLRRYSLYMDAIYMLLILWSVLHLHSITAAELGRLMARHCVLQIALGFWAPRLVCSWLETPAIAPPKDKVE